jgi:hypothetical protein
MRRTVSLHVFAACLPAFVAGAGWCQELSDPTKPPAGFYVGAGPGRPGQNGNLVLQSVLIFPDVRSAIINGEHVSLGEKIGGQRLVRVSETEVVLLDGGIRRTLKLFPGVEKRPSSGTDRGP